MAFLLLLLPLQAADCGLRAAGCGLLATARERRCCSVVGAVGGDVLCCCGCQTIPYVLRPPRC